jgi:hypothetical protein
MMEESKVATGFTFQVRVFQPDSGEALVVLVIGSPKAGTDMSIGLTFDVARTLSEQLALQADRVEKWRTI